MARGRAVRLVLLIALAQAGTAVLFAGLVASLGNTLERNGDWISTKRKLAVMSSGAFLATRIPLVGGRVDLSRWHGFQEIVYREPLALREVEFEFLLDEQAYLCFVFGHEDARYHGLRLSLHPRFPSLAFTARPSGEFLSTQALPALPLRPDTWIEAHVAFERGEVALRLDGREVARVAADPPERQRFGFRGCYRRVRVDGVVARHGEPARKFREGFESEGRFLLALLGALAVLGVLDLVLIRRAANPGFALLSLSLALLVCTGAVRFVDRRWFSKRYPPFDRTRALDRQQVYIDRVRARIAGHGAAPATGTTRILFLGSSQTDGSAAASREETFVCVTERLLNEGTTGARYECINGGVSSVHSKHLVTLYRDEWAALGSRLLVVHLSSNDGDTRLFEENLVEIVRIARENGTRVLFSLEANSEEAAPGELAQHAVMRAVGERLGVPVADVHGHLRENGHRGLLWWDFVHPSSFGHALIAECLAPRIRDLAAGLK